MVAAGSGLNAGLGDKKSLNHLAPFIEFSAALLTSAAPPKSLPLICRLANDWRPGSTLWAMSPAKFDSPIPLLSQGIDDYLKEPRNQEPRAGIEETFEHLDGERLTLEVNRPSRRPDAEQRRGSRNKKEHG